MIFCRRNLVGKLATAFTLIELVIVIAIIGITMGLFLARSSTSIYWKQEAMIRKLSEMIPFLHNQAIADQAYYRLEFDFAKNSYRIGVMKAEYENEDVQDIATEGAGNLTLELAFFLNPSIGRTQTMIPPPSYPSLAEPVQLLPGTYIEDIRTMRGEKTKAQGGKAYIMFSPRGFSEFAVIHLRLGGDAPLTILVNPFTGLAEIYRDYKEFEWTHGKKTKKT